jgi:hypothetical protein
MQHYLQPLYWVLMFEQSMWLWIFNSQFVINFMNVAGREGREEEDIFSQDKRMINVDYIFVV